MFAESLTPRPELENGQDPKRMTRVLQVQRRPKWALGVIDARLYETTCLGALHEQSGEGVVSPLNHSGAQALQFEPAPPGC